jgi:PadR family transcriptional regulator, regulatory protein PadR
MDFSEELVRGSIVPIVLSLLKKQDMYGYEMVREVNARSSGALEWREGTLYPALHRMESQDLITSYWEEGKETGKPRKYYALTAKGKKELEQRAKEWASFTVAVNSVMQSS